MTDHSAEQALAGVRIIDLTQLLAGPIATMLMADLGAEVIKVEAPGSGEMSRTTGSLHQNGVASIFLSLNRNKKSVTIDLKQKAGKELFLRLVESADAVVENFRPATMERLGLGYEVLRERNPRLVYCAVSAFGSHGPYRDKSGIDPIIQAMGGVMSITGEQGRPPIKTGPPAADFNAAMLAAYGLMAALFHRERTGVGQRVDLSLFGATVFSLMPREQDYFVTGVPLAPMGSGHAQIVPYQAFATQDHYIYIAVNHDKFWAPCCRALGVEHLITDPRFAHNADRVRNRDLLTPLIEETLLKKPSREWLAALDSERVPCGPINNLRQVFEDPQVIADEAVVTVAHPQAGDVKVLAMPLRFERTPAAVRTPPPQLGEHTVDVLLNAGYGADEIEKLRKQGVI